MNSFQSLYCSCEHVAACVKSMTSLQIRSASISQTLDHDAGCDIPARATIALSAVAVTVLGVTLQVVAVLCTVLVVLRGFACTLGPSGSMRSAAV